VRLGAERVQVLAGIVRTHREALIPARETVVERSQQEQNFMLIGVFELIQAKTQEYEAYQGYLESIRDYWLARLDLMRVVGARLPSEQQASGQTPGISEILTPRGIAMDHGGHGAAASGAAAAPPPRADMPGMDHSAHDVPAASPSPAPPPAHQHPGSPS
jgi:cobalt-zinc-cadmium efflux system outer membrane protein